MRAVARTERKFLLNLVTAKRLEALLAPALAPDPHNGDDGYSVRSVYFDTPFDRDLAEKLDGLRLRRKVRLRVYDPAGDQAFLEVKQKEGDRQLKRSLPLGRDEAERLLRAEYDLLLARPEPFAWEAHGLLAGYGYRPKSLVACRRRAFAAKENAIRITLDADLRASELCLDPFAPEPALAPALDPFQVLLEVKYQGFLLSYIRELLNTANAGEVSLSKYALSRSATLALGWAP